MVLFSSLNFQSGFWWISRNITNITWMVWNKKVHKSIEKSISRLQTTKYSKFKSLYLSKSYTYLYNFILLPSYNLPWDDFSGVHQWKKFSYRNYTHKAWNWDGLYSCGGLGNVTFHKQQECGYGFPSLPLATRASADVSEWFLSASGKAMSV